MSETKTSLLALNDPKPLMQLEEISSELSTALANCQSEALEAAYTAKAIHLLRKGLTDEMVKQFSALQNTSLGFKTDKKEGYDIGTVRECIIHAFLRGTRIVGNEFNLIAGNHYITKEGFQGLMVRDRNFSDVDINLGVPVIERENKRAIVRYKATWKYAGVADSIEGEVPVKWETTTSRFGKEYETTDDAVLGKAERKVRARIWTKATGNNLPDGEAEGESTALQPRNVTGTAKTVDLDAGLTAIERPEEVAAETEVVEQ